MAARGTYALILMDMQMPQMNGLDAARAIRRLPDLAATPILAMTANAFIDDRNACEAAGMNDFIAKPVDPQALYQTLLEWLRPAARRAGSVITENREADAMASSVDPGETLRRLESISGFDAAKGVPRVPTKIASYLRVLKVFVDNNRDTARQLTDAIAAEDFDVLKRVAHNLKGSAGYLGAVRVHEAAEALDAAIARQTGKDEVAALGKALAEVLNRLIDDLHEVLGQP